jgi:hypothetical protein
MTWSLINQLVVESRVTRSVLRRRVHFQVQDLAVLSGLISVKGHRVFGVGVMDEALADGASGTALSLKATPLGVQDYCSAFLLPGAQTKLSDVSFVRPARQFFPSLSRFNFVQALTGSFFFWVGSLRTLHAFGCAFLKTRGFLILRMRLYNQARRRSYILPFDSFMQIWKFGDVSVVQTVFFGAFQCFLLFLLFLRGWLVFFLLQRLV